MDLWSVSGCHIGGKTFLNLYDAIWTSWIKTSLADEQCVPHSGTKKNLSVELAGCKPSGLFPLNGFDVFWWMTASAKVNRCRTKQAPARVWQGRPSGSKQRVECKTSDLKITRSDLLFLFHPLRRQSRLFHMRCRSNSIERQTLHPDKGPLWAVRGPGITHSP